MSQDRRRFTRIRFAGAARINGEIRTQLIDISLKGVLLARPECWSGALDESIDTEIFLDGGTVIHMQGSVAHLEDTCIGVLCRHIDMDSITHLRRLIELNAGDPELLQRELAQLGS
jgi:hypothetical protein